MPDDLDPDLRAEIDRRVAAGEVTRYPAGASSPESEIRPHPFRNYRFGKSSAAARKAKEAAEPPRARQAVEFFGCPEWDRRGEPAVDVAMRNGLVPMDGNDA